MFLSKLEFIIPLDLLFVSSVQHFISENRMSKCMNSRGDVSAIVLNRHEQNAINTDFELWHVFDKNALLYFSFEGFAIDFLREH